MKVYAEFGFLENRDYIHSTSWLYKLLDILIEKKYICSDSEINKINAVFRSKKNRQGYYLIDEESQNGDIVFHIYTNSKKIKVYYIEDGAKVETHIPYNEDMMVNDGIINRDYTSASIEVSCINNIYNLIVSLNKKLLLNLLPKDGYSSWSVGKFSINWKVLHSNAEGNILQTKLVNNIDNLYCQSSIFISGHLAGSIDFARKKAAV